MPPQPRRSYNSSIRGTIKRCLGRKRKRRQRIGCGFRCICATSAVYNFERLSRSTSRRERFSPFFAAGAKRGGSRTASPCIFCTAQTTEPVAEVELSPQTTDPVAVGLRLVNKECTKMHSPDLFLPLRVDTSTNNSLPHRRQLSIAPTNKPTDRLTDWTTAVAAAA